MLIDQSFRLGILMSSLLKIFKIENFKIRCYWIGSAGNLLLSPIFCWANLRFSLFAKSIQ